MAPLLPTSDGAVDAHGDEILAFPPSEVRRHGLRQFQSLSERHGSSHGISLDDVF
jgi:hypothetical protein